MSEGSLGIDITVHIRDVEGCDQFIHILPSMVNWVGETTSLPVGLIDLNRRNRRVLIELSIVGWIGFQAAAPESLLKDGHPRSVNAYVS